jgi:hypothetical protein
MRTLQVIFRLNHPFPAIHTEFLSLPIKVIGKLHEEDVARQMCFDIASILQEAYGLIAKALKEDLEFSDELKGLLALPTYQLARHMPAGVDILCSADASLIASGEVLVIQGPTCLKQLTKNLRSGEGGVYVEAKQEDPEVEEPEPETPHVIH